MEQYINKSALVAEIERLMTIYNDDDDIHHVAKYNILVDILSIINTLEVKEVNEVPATVMVNKYGNRFISSWSGLKEYDDLKEGQEIKIVISKK